jgi:hypothetical protein
MTGDVVYFYAFDVANEIAASRIGPILGLQPKPLELRLKYAYPKDVKLHRPLAVESPPLTARLGGQPVRLQVHIFTIGVVSLVMRVAVERKSLDDLRTYHEPKLDDGRQLDELAAELFAKVARDLESALVRPSLPEEPEAYTVFCLSDPECDGDVNRWLTGQRAPVAGLLADLPAERLSEAHVADVLRQTSSLEKSDLVVIDWDAALVVDLAGPPDDVLYVLEVANLQLEEFKMMDHTLDGALDKAYDDLERRALSLFRSPSRTLRKLRWLRVDLTHLADEVTNITKFVGDWYLARVYLAARERFHLDRWRQSVEQRLSQLDQFYSVVQNEVYERRMLWLEILIAVFFAIDLYAIFFLRR